MFKVVLICCLLVACGQSKDDFSQPKEAAQAEEVKAPEHHYAVYMDGEYGYQPEVSENQRNDGKVASTLFMVKYLGEKNGKYQLFTKQNEKLMTVMECQKPCEYIKVNHIISGLGVVKTEVMEAAPDSLGRLAFEDAINGQLEQFVKEDSGKQYTVWLQGKNLQRSLVN